MCFDKVHTVWFQPLVIMEVPVKEFLLSSTIHGLSYIGSNKSLLRLFWVGVVTTGFIGAGVLIQQSFSSWATSPVSTTIETHPISKIDFPNVTLCPPRQSGALSLIEIAEMLCSDWLNLTRRASMSM